MKAKNEFGEKIKTRLYVMKYTKEVIIEVPYDFNHADLKKMNKGISIGLMDAIYNHPYPVKDYIEYRFINNEEKIITEDFDLVLKLDNKLLEAIDGLKFKKE